MLSMHTGFNGSLASCRIIKAAAFILFLLPTAAYAGNNTAENTKGQFTPTLTTFKPKPMSSLTIYDMDNQKQETKNLYQKMTILHFWAVWCAPCILEMPEINQIQKKYQHQGLKIIPISLDGIKNLPKVREFMLKKKLSSINAYMDDNMSAYKSANINGLPYSIFIDENGNEFARMNGVMKWDSSQTIALIESHLPKKILPAK